MFTALTLALLGAIDSLLTSVVADNMTKTRHKPNKELIGQGIGNSISAMFGGIPGAGGDDSYGSKYQLRWKNPYLGNGCRNCVVDDFVIV